MKTAACRITLSLCEIHFHTSDLLCHLVLSVEILTHYCAWNFVTSLDVSTPQWLCNEMALFLFFNF